MPARPIVPLKRGMLDPSTGVGDADVVLPWHRSQAETLTLCSGLVPAAYKDEESLIIIPEKNSLKAAYPIPRLPLFSTVPTGNRIASSP